MNWRRIAHTVGPKLAPLVAAVIAYGDPVRARHILADESEYVCAARALAHGQSPYSCARYLYPPLLAQLQATAAGYASEHSVLLALRALNLIGGVVIIELSVALLPLRPWPRAAVSAGLVAWSPGLHDALQVGNVSPLIVALLLVALSMWPTRPLRAGTALALSIALKPLGPVAWLLLCCHRPLNAEHGRAQRVATVVAAGVLGLLLWPGRSELARLPQQGFRHLAALHDASLQRFGHLLGITLSPFWVFAAVGVIATVYVRRRRLAPPALLYASCTAALFSQPLVWCHTLLLAYPLVAAALAKVLRTTSKLEPASVRLATMLSVLLAALSVLQSELFGDLGEYCPRPIAALLEIVPLALVLVLTRYVIRENPAHAEMS